MRLIDADELKECIKDRFKIETEENLLQYKSLQEILEFMLRKFEDKVIHRIDLQPTVDAVPVVHGEWIKGDLGEWKCSVCREENCYAYDENLKKFTDLYCPNCGADMRKKV